MKEMKGKGMKSASECCKMQDHSYLGHFKGCMDEGHNSSGKPPLGEGGRFKALTKKLSAKGAENPAALAAYIGRKKYGKSKFQKLAAKGRKQG